MMKQDVRAFDPIRYARIRAYNDETGKKMSSLPIPCDAQGNHVCAPLGEGRWQIGWEWDQPRDILGVQVCFAEGSALPTDWHVEYWHYSWPNEHKDRRVGAHKGWLLTDDAFHGRWLAAYGEQTADAAGCSVIFDPVDVNELLCLGGDAPQNLFLSDDYNALFRRALKFRIVFEGETAPTVRKIALTGDAAVRESACVLYPNATGKVGVGEATVEAVWNGELLAGQGTTKRPVRLAYLRTEGAKTEADQTILTLRTGGISFGVRAEDIENGVYMEDFDLLLAPEEMGEDPAAIIRKLSEGKRSLFDRVPLYGEQSVANAMAEIPAMIKNRQPRYGRYVPMGWDGARQKFALRFNGDIFANKIDQKVSRRDTAKTRWAAAELHFRIASGDPPRRNEGNEDAEQSMPDACVPVYVTRWTDRDVAYEQTTFATLMAPTPAEMRGDEDVMVMNRVALRNASAEPRAARLMVEVYPAEQLALVGDRLLACGRVRPGNTPTVGWTVQPYPEKYLRMQACTGGRGELRCIPFTAAGTTSLSMQPQFGFEGYDHNTVRQPPSSCVSTTLLYEVLLAPGETHTLDLILPYPSLSGTKDWEALDRRDFDMELARVREHWLAYAERGARVTLPEENKLNDFARAVPWHVALTVMRDPHTGLFMVPAGTYGYGVCGNEASLQIRMLDELGYHEEAEKYLETFVKTQGMGGMDGNFAGCDGALVALNFGGYSDSATSPFAYNLDHGYILNCMVDHYRLTGNRTWLKRIADTLVKACDFIFTERKATLRLDEQGQKVSYYGLMPHGHLEDNPEWRCWFAVNAHACGGILRVVDALKDIEHPEAKRIGLEAVAYRDDIRDCVLRAVAKSPAVPTGNGGYMPHVPTQAEIRGRDWGWFREVAYGPLHLASEHVFDVNDPITGWILRDEEDNLFLSRDYGRAVDRERDWFSRGGMTIQANLLFNDRVFLERGESERAVRTLFNNFAQNLYRDVSCFTEHPITDFGLGFGPFYKTPDEAQFIVNLRNHLLLETGDTLRLLPGAPRDWLSAGKTLSFERMATFFGPVGVNVTAGRNEIELTVKAEWRKAPGTLAVCLRTPERKTPVTITLNGEPLTDPLWKGETLLLSNPPKNLRLTLKY